jgi:hypothetical protein
METATQPQAKRTRFDSSVLSPDDTIATPMAAARSTLLAHCASLQPEIATLLSTLGKEHLSLMQKELHKCTQVRKMSADVPLIPRSARIKFVLTASKLAEADEGYIRLKEETEIIVSTFQADLKQKIIDLAKLEASLVRKHIIQSLTTHFFVVSKALLICDNLTTDPHRIVNTIFEQYSLPLRASFDMTAENFRNLYRHVHSLTDLPPPIPAVLPTIGHNEPAVPSPVYQSVVKIYRVIDNIFIAPWTSYLDAQKRLDVTAALKTLRVEHLEPAATDTAAMLIDAEPAADPPHLRDLIDKQVDKRTSSLQKEVAALRSLITSSNAKNSTRGQSPGASIKKKIRGTAAAPGSATPSAAGQTRQKPSPKPRSNRKSKSKGQTRLRK